MEAMQEKSVTAGGETRKLPRPFFVLATQNPLEMEGTYPLPEAQLDRFLFKLLVQFPSAAELEGILQSTTGTESVIPAAQADADEVLQMMELAREVPVAQRVGQMAVRLVIGTHPDSEFAPEGVKKYVRCGASPRAGQALISAGKVRALLEGRYNVAFEDIAELALPVLRHRILLNFEGEAEGISTDAIIRELWQHLWENHRPA